MWGDLLTSFDGKAIVYDAIGNPTSIGVTENGGGRTYTWEHGRQLSTLTEGSTQWTYEYNADGMRTKRSNGTTTYEYTYNGSQLTQMKLGNDIYNFTYDANGVPVTVTHNGTTYYYATNVQGDVVSILDSTGASVVNYSYDAWGKPLSVTGTMAATLGAVNPLCYRGYIYDQETGLYYVSSRYYDPEIGRWINADGEMTDVGGDILGYNLFAYCFNNPVNMDDPSGEWPKWLSGALNVVSGVAQMAAGAALGAFTSWTGIGAVAAGFLIVNGAATVAQGTGQIVNHVTKSNTLREDNIVRTGVQEVGRTIGGDTGAKVAGGVYDIAVVAANLYAGKVSLEKSMPKIIESKVFSANNGYGIKLGKNIEMFYRNPNAAGGPGGTIFSYKGPLGKFRIDWDLAHGFHCHPPGH